MRGHKRLVSGAVIIAALLLLVACSNGNNDGSEDFTNKDNFDHNLVAGEACFTCHNGLNATGKPSFHINTTNLCNACHTTTMWSPTTSVDHNEVLGSCADCHNGIVARGKSINHLVTSNNCEACHSTSAWSPGLQVDHTQVIGTCVSCHNNFFAQGKPLIHINSTDVCDACHEVYPAHWAPVPPGAVDHTQVLGTCSSCHDSMLASDKPANHMTTTLDCGVCHVTTGWLPATLP